MTATRIRTQVLVAGAGPVGAFAAYCLAKAGIDTILVEALSDCPEDMRASTLHPPTLDMLAKLGVLDALDAQGLRAPVYQYRNRQSGSVIEFDLTELADMSAHPYRLQCEQFKIARLLVEKTQAEPYGTAWFEHRVLAYSQGADGVTVEVQSPAGVKHVRADYVIAADGANSTLRKLSGVPFNGFTYPERFLTLSTRCPLERHLSDLAGVNYISDSDEWCVLLRVPEFWRVLVPTLASESDASLLSDGKKDAVFVGLVGLGTFVETQHRTLYRVHQRVAQRFRHGRILLVGDAAHLNNPLGGFGMNSGIHDTWNLTAKLRDILIDGTDPDTSLDLFDRQRRTVAKTFVQRQTIENKKIMENAQGAVVQEERLRAIAENPVLRRDYLLRQSMYESLKHEAGVV